MVPVGAILAGGAGRRIGGDKAVVELANRPLLLYPLDALRAVTPEVAVVAKRETALPSLAGEANVWVEPDEPRHPLTGIVHALRLAAGRPVLVVAADMVLLDEHTLLTLLATPLEGAPAVVPRVDGQIEPLCALYTAEALDALDGFDPGARVTDAVLALGPRLVDFEDATPFINVNAPEDLLTAAVLLRSRA